MTEHSEAEAWGGDHTGKQQTLRPADFTLPLSGIILLLLHRLWKVQWCHCEVPGLHCLDLRNRPQQVIANYLVTFINTEPKKKNKELPSRDPLFNLNSNKSALWYRKHSRKSLKLSLSLLLISRYVKVISRDKNKRSGQSNKKAEWLGWAERRRVSLSRGLPSVLH